eukprot:scaffold167550_cov19-Tisochrysis_lutea.AAC.1
MKWYNPMTWHILKPKGTEGFKGEGLRGGISMVRWLWRQCSDRLPLVWLAVSTYEPYELQTRSEISCSFDQGCLGAGCTRGMEGMINVGQLW